MKRVATAIQKGRCVLVLGSALQSEAGARAALADRPNLPVLRLGQDTISAEKLAAVSGRGGGLLVLVEPDPMGDGRALEALGKVLKKSRAKPQVLLVAPMFNPFGLPVTLRLMRIEHHKGRGSELLAALPTDGAAAAPAPAKKKNAGAPRPILVGREEEKVALSEALCAGGPVLLHGPMGVGRGWLLDQVLSESETLSQVLSYVMRRDAGFDGLANLIAVASGDEALQEGLKKGTLGTPAEQVDALIAALSADSLKGKVIRLVGLEGQLFRDGSLARQDRLGMLLQALLTRPGQQASVVLISGQAPRLKGSAEVLQVVPVAGLKGKEIFGVFEAYHAEAAPRDKMGEVYNQTAGHPMAARAYAVAWRDSDKPEKLFDDKKLLKMVQVDNIEVLQRHLVRKVERLPAPLKAALMLVGHSPDGMSGQELSSQQINREQRMQLTRAGLMEVSLHGEPRKYRLHPLLAHALPLRDLSDFDTLEKVARLIAKRFEGLSGCEQLSLGQEVNRLLVSARRERSCRELEYVDMQPGLNSVLGLIRGRTPRLEMALQRVNGLLKRAPHNPELLTAKAEVVASMDGKPEDIDALLAIAYEKCPTPEVFHWEASWRLRRRRKGDQGRAVDALTRGREVFPTESSLARRLGAVLAEQRRWAEAEVALNQGIELDPSQPEAYSRLGEVLAAQGVERYAAAADAIRYALELEPGREVHQRRLAKLLRLQAFFATEGKEALISQAKELMEASLKGKVKGYEPYLELAELLLDTEGDTERASWAARKAAKAAQKNNVDVQIVLARVDTRLGRLSQAEGRLSRAITSANHEAAGRGAMGELLFARGKVFAAHQELVHAIKLSREGSALQARLKQQAGKIEVLIASGQAVDIEKAAEAAIAAEAEAKKQATLAHAEVKMTSDRGNTVVRRKGHVEPVPTPESSVVAALPHLHSQTLAPSESAPAPAPAAAVPAVEAAPAAVEAAPAAVEEPESPVVVAPAAEPVVQPPAAEPTESQ